MGVLIAVLAVVVPSSSWDEPVAPWGANHHPTNVAKRHVEEIAADRLAYAVRQGARWMARTAARRSAWG